MISYIFLWYHSQYHKMNYKKPFLRYFHGISYMISDNDIIHDIVCDLYMISYNFAFWYRSENFCKSLNTSYDQIMLISKPLISMLFSLLPKRSCIRSLLDCTESISCQPQCMRSKRFCAAQRLWKATTRTVRRYILSRSKDWNRSLPDWGIALHLSTQVQAQLRLRQSMPHIFTTCMSRTMMENTWRETAWKSYAQSAFSSAWSYSPWGKVYVKL